MLTGRELVTKVVAERCAAHTTSEQVQMTLSFARAERLLGREYHGRFLIELLQNAADAWRAAGRTGRSRVRVVLDDEGLALLVANQGAAFPAEVVLNSLGHIGRSTKAAGEAIGHKGIGFKSVLEVSRTPELFSGLAAGGADHLSLRFDPALALRRIREASPAWPTLLEEVREPDTSETDCVPVLRYPTWLAEQPVRVQELAGDGFDTVVRLPWTDADQPAWLDRVRASFNDVTDQILLLLGTFDAVSIEDHLAGTSKDIVPEVVSSTHLASGTEVERIVVRRGKATSSRWALYRRTEHGRSLAGDTAVGVRLAQDAEGPARAVRTFPDEPAAPFHLFFPTAIGSGLPFLAHGYFQVDAARTGFFRGAIKENDAVLDALADLTAEAVQDLAGNPDVDLLSLFELVAATPLPEDPQARRFRDRALNALDDTAWVPLAEGRARPHDLLQDEDSDLDRHVARTFPSAYVHTQTGMHLPHPGLSDDARRLLASRRPDGSMRTWDALPRLLRPGAQSPWLDSEVEARFLALLELIAALEVNAPARTGALLEAVRGDREARLIPVVAEGGGRRLLAVPDPARSAAGHLSTLVMARVRTAPGAELAPPDALDVAFLPDGLLTGDAQLDRAKPIGVRPFTVDNVLDRLAALEQQQGDPAVVTFLWRLLARERSEYGTSAASMQALSSFEPGTWFWCKPGRAEISENDAVRQRRERLLSRVRLPARDGSWRPAGDLVFGSDWADWLESSFGSEDRVASERASAYRLLETVAPGTPALLASPTDLLPLLPAVTVPAATLDDDNSSSADAATDDPSVQDRQRLAFLLRLGIWETIPVTAYEDRIARENPTLPWQALRDDLDPLAGEPWNFEPHKWGGRRHVNVNISEDFWFEWKLETDDPVRRRALAQLIASGCDLWLELAGASAFCPQCNDGIGGHRVRYRTSAEERRPSTLALQLRSSPWLPARLAGDPLAEGVSPLAAWWVDRMPTGAALTTSPLRHLVAAEPDLDLPGSLRRLIGLEDLSHASAERLERLLLEAKELVEEGDIRADSGHGRAGSRQSFVALHRQAYDRLAELEGGAPVLERTSALCEQGQLLVYANPADARHDDGRFAAYRRHFSAALPFAVISRDRTATASVLGIPRFDVAIERLSADEGVDVTEELAPLLTDRSAELLAILVHHTLGSATLQPTSPQFEERSRRLRNLRVSQVDDLVLRASVVDADVAVTIGDGPDQDLFLQGPTTTHPVLFHDFSGEGWTERLRRKLAQPLAAVLENPAYAATFALFLLADSTADREQVLQDLGIAPADVDAIRVRLGAVSIEEQRRQQRWFTAVLQVLRPGTTFAELAVEPEALTEQLRTAGVEAELSRRLVEAGGGEDVRADTGLDSALALLTDHGADLAALDAELRRLGDSGLEITVSRQMLRDWTRRHERRLAVILVRTLGDAAAKSAAAGLRPPPDTRYRLTPEMSEVLAPIASLLVASGLNLDVERLAVDPETELVRLAGVGSVAELDARVEALYDPEERARVLRDRARLWRTELIVLSALARTVPGETRTATRGHARDVAALLPSAPATPSELAPSLDGLLAAHPDLVQYIANLLIDSLTSAGPDRTKLMTVAEKSGLTTHLLARVVQALDEPRRDLGRDIRERAQRLRQEAVVLRPPAALATRYAATPKRAPKRKVARIKVEPGADRRKKHLGDEGEKWALASVLEPVLLLEPAARAEAVRSLVEFLSRFEGSSVDAVLAHADAAASRDLEGDELLEELAGLFHVSRESDAFGFDILGWVSVGDHAPRATALEVKSSGDGSFHLSRNEWALARQFHDDGLGDQYAVLVVRRGTGSRPPKRLDLLQDPVDLVESLLLSKDDDGYLFRYTVERTA